MDKIKNYRNFISWWRKNNIPPGHANISSLKIALEDAKKDDSIPQEEIVNITKKLTEVYHDEIYSGKQRV